MISPTPARKEPLGLLNRRTVRLEHCHKSPKLSAVAVQHLSDALYCCFIIYAVKIDSTQQLAASIQDVDTVVRSLFEITVHDAAPFL